MKRLTLAYKGKVIVSGAFNMGAYRVVFDALTGAAGFSAEMVDAAALEGVIAMYDGTELTEGVIRGAKGLDGKELMSNCAVLMQWFHAVKVRADSPPTTGTMPDKPLLSVYSTLLKLYSILPSEVDKQDPQLLFDVMATEPPQSADPDLYGDIPGEDRAL